MTNCRSNVVLKGLKKSIGTTPFLTRTTAHHQHPAKQNLTWSVLLAVPPAPYIWRILVLPKFLWGVTLTGYEAYSTSFRSSTWFLVHNNEPSLSFLEDFDSPGRAFNPLATAKGLRLTGHIWIWPLYSKPTNPEFQHSWLLPPNHAR